MEIKTESSPIGSVVADQSIDIFVANMQKMWNDANQPGGISRFWKKVNFTSVVSFLIQCLDELVNYFIEHNIPGADKKATVLSTLSIIYDHIITGTLPIWLKPTAPLIKKFIFNVVLSASIDWVVNKYKNGSWRPKTKEEVFAQWNTVFVQNFGEINSFHLPS